MPSKTWPVGSREGRTEISKSPSQGKQSIYQHHILCPFPWPYPLSSPTIIHCPSPPVHPQSTPTHIHCPYLHPLSTPSHIYCPRPLISTVHVHSHPLSMSTHIHCPSPHSYPLSTPTHIHCPCPPPHPPSTPTHIHCPHALTLTVHAHLYIHGKSV